LGIEIQLHKLQESAKGALQNNTVMRYGMIPGVSQAKLLRQAFPADSSAPPPVFYAAARYVFMQVQV